MRTAVQLVRHPAGHDMNELPAQTLAWLEALGLFGSRLDRLLRNQIAILALFGDRGGPVSARLATAGFSRSASVPRLFCLRSDPLGLVWAARVLMLAELSPPPL